MFEVVVPFFKGSSLGKIFSVFFRIKRQTAGSAFSAGFVHIARLLFGLFDFIFVYPLGRKGTKQLNPRFALLKISGSKARVQHNQGE